MKEPKTQDQIKLSNMQSDHIMAWVSDKPQKSLGAVLHWLYVYATFDISEIATVGQGEVNYQNKKFATFHFDEKREMVIFDECFHEY